VLAGFFALVVELVVLDLGSVLDLYMCSAGFLMMAHQTRRQRRTPR
jgi:hypothetical protein